MSPFTRILVAVDFSEASARSLAYAARLSRRLDAELIVVHVVHALLAAEAAERNLPLVSETQAFLESFGATASRTPVRARYQAVAGVPSDTIMNIAVRENADLIVTGSQGVAMSERVAYGSTTERLLRHSKTSVLVVPDSGAPASDTTEMRVGPIIVGLECAGGAADAARAAKHLARALNTDLRFVHAVSEIKTAPQWSNLASDALRRRCDTARRELTTLLSGLSLEAERLDVQVGAVPNVLANATASEPDALLILGRCYGAPGHAGAAAMARRMLTLASVPVLMHVTPV